MTPHGSDWTSLRRLGPADRRQLLKAAHLFDRPPSVESADRFLAAPGHHLLLAVDEGGRAVGFVSGIEMSHPDKAPSCSCTSWGSSPSPAATGRRLVDSLVALAAEFGCRGVWTLTEPDNEPALATYRSARAQQESGARIAEWVLPGTSPDPAVG